jgi:tetratricopeptide (TPR) repeat protein
MDVEEMASLGVSAYQTGDFVAAIKYLEPLAGKEPQLWQFRFYLAMAYCRSSQLKESMREFKEIADWCPDNDLNVKALAALRTLHHQLEIQRKMESGELLENANNHQRFA